MRVFSYFLSLPVIRFVMWVSISHVVFSGAVYAENDKAFFWQINSGSASDETTVYLMGSIHFADNSFYPLRKEIEQAFDRSDYLAVELDINEADHAAYNNILAERGVFEGSKTIKDVIADDTWMQLRQRLSYLNVSYDAVKKYKPGIMVLTLSGLQVMKLGFDPELGIDAYFLAKAKQPNTKSGSKKTIAKKIIGKNIIELESLEQQINLFLDIPDGDLLLKESLYSLDESQMLMAEIVRYWKTGDEKLMSKLLFEDALTDYPAFSDIYDKLFYDRNQQMTSKIIDMLESKGTYFVVVGSGHLVGEKGVVNLLREKGYDAERR